MRRHRFSTRIYQHGINPCVDVPRAVSAAFNRRRHIPVKGTIDGHSFRATLVPIGGGRHRLYINGFMRKATGVAVGDRVRLALELDPASRSGQVPWGVNPRPAVRRGLGTAVAAQALWTCPKCGHRFVTRNMWHSCTRYRLADHFAGKDPGVKRVFDRLRRLVEACGPVTVYAQKTRIVFQGRVRFGGCVVRRRWLDGGLWLTRRAEHPKLVGVEQPIAGCFVHRFRLAAVADLDAGLAGLIREAYAVGQQRR